MSRASKQSGLTLIVSLIMLVVLTLIVVSAVRFGNINLRIAGNAQSEAEAMAAAQVAVDSAVAAIDAATNINDIVARPAVAQSTGGATYTVAISKPECTVTRTINNTELDDANPNDKICFAPPGAVPIIDENGNLVAASLNCKDQVWEVQASVANDSKSSVKVSVTQGVAVRVGPAVLCP